MKIRYQQYTSDLSDSAIDQDKQIEFLLDNCYTRKPNNPIDKMKVRNANNVNAKKTRRGLFLVKFSDNFKEMLFNGPPTEQVGRIKISKDGTKSTVIVLNDNVRPETCPPQHEFVEFEEKPGTIDGRVFLRKEEESSTSPVESRGVEVGKVLNRCNMMPIYDENFATACLGRFEADMKDAELKAAEIKEVEPELYVPKIRKPKPAPKKEKNARQDKEWVIEKVVEILHERKNCSFKSLLQATAQPAAYLRNILKEICNYNASGKNRGTYELKEDFDNGQG